MKQAAWAAIFAVAGAGAAAAQEDRKLEDLKREFERSMKVLQEKFEAERARLEKEFKAGVERLKGSGKAEPKKDDGGKGKGARPALEDLVERLIERVERLEERLEGLGGLHRALPKDFDFKRFGDFKKFEDWRELVPPRFREFMPQEGDKEFRFEFKLPPGLRKKVEEKREEEKKERDPKKEKESF